MSTTAIWIIFIAIIAVLVIGVGYIGNKVVDKGADAIRNKAVRKQNQEPPGKAENLADRYKHLPKE